MAEKPHILSSQVPPEGRELLDSIGLVKRFWEGDRREFPSTSTLAGWDFFLEARTKAPDELKRYRDAVEALRLYKARKNEVDFPYDGDLFFEETLTRQRMKTSYGKEVDEATLRQWKELLKGLIRKTGKSPSPYYMLVQFDGDGVGTKIDHLLDVGKADQAEEKHRRFSDNIASFSKKAEGILQPEKGGFLIYNGGDDVFFLASREKGLGLAGKLAEEYRQTVGQGLNLEATASAGVVIAHHLTPLAHALSLLHEAERNAKAVKKDHLGNKGMVCLTLAKRGGEALSALSPWEAVTNFEAWVKAFQNQEVAAVFPYTLAREAETLQALNARAMTSMVRYWLGRHSSEKVSKERKEELLETLTTWVEAIEAKTGKPALEETIRWLIMARFLASGGAE